MTNVNKTDEDEGNHLDQVRGLPDFAMMRIMGMMRMVRMVRMMRMMKTLMRMTRMMVITLIKSEAWEILQCLTSVPLIKSSRS